MRDNGGDRVKVIKSGQILDIILKMVPRQALLTNWMWGVREKEEQKLTLKFLA